ncbi:MAG: DNA polymerase III subunit gamma/tau [Candidatus Sericytochromatia bacterium]|nr:DNA polymerase III subunit gamma/tau [Candidatus Sericytochromatia bacterium]
MTQLALYRKWRPQRFAEVVGQAHISRILLNALRQNRLAHAYLFCGPRGTGKTTSARLLAKALNCEQPVDAEPCNQCQSCLEITAGHSLDVIEIDAASNRGIDSARDLREQVRFAASGGRYRVFIIDEFHMLTKEAFNALLKTLEEPPERVIFVLATTEPHEVLPTIISRCQRFDFQRIATRELAEHLRTVAAAEQIGVSEAVLDALARKANGGLRDGLSLLDQVRALGLPGEQLPDVLVYQVLGLVQEEALIQLLQAAFSGDLPMLIETLHQMLAQGHDPQQIVQELLQLLRHLSLAALPPEALETLGVPSHLLTPVKTLGESVSRGALASALEHLLRCSDRLHHCAQPEIWLEADLMALALQAEPALLERVERLEQGAPVRPAAPPRPARPAVSDTAPAYQTAPAAPVRPASAGAATAPAPPVPAASEPAPATPAPAAPEPAPAVDTAAPDLNDLNGLWQALLSKLKLKAPLLYGFVAAGQLQQVHAASQTWIIAYAADKEPMMRQLQQRLKDGKLQGLIAELVGSSYGVQLISEGQAPIAQEAGKTEVPASAPPVPAEKPPVQPAVPTRTPQQPPPSAPVPEARPATPAALIRPAPSLPEPDLQEADDFVEIDMDFMPEEGQAEPVASEAEPAAPVSRPPASPASDPQPVPAPARPAAAVAVAEAPVPSPAQPVAAAAAAETAAGPPHLPEQAHLQEIADLFKGKVVRSSP